MIKYLLVPTLVFFSYIHSQGGEFELSDQHIGFFMTKGGYRSVWVDYSYGRRYPYRPWIDSVWKKPKLVHCDIRPFLIDPIADIEEGIQQ